jgi:hypothetical protein
VLFRRAVAAFLDLTTRTVDQSSPFGAEAVASM